MLHVATAKQHRDTPVELCYVHAKKNGPKCVQACGDCRGVACHNTEANRFEIDSIRDEAIPEGVFDV